jgi:LAO/AO transport system kinase
MSASLKVPEADGGLGRAPGVRPTKPVPTQAAGVPVMQTRGPRRLPLERYLQGVLGGDRMILARAITVIESNLPADGELAARLLDAVLPHTGHALRVGITGVPGVGKSTFIDALGMHLIRDRGENVAVLSVDPSSAISRGSILGDKTRMERLAVEDRAFIRPSPSQGHLGGVARRTRETILLCEAAGYRNILVETVGVGQSETAVRSMTDFFLLLMLAGAGDELQGMKRGIIEMLDGMAINKADGDNKPKAERARIEYAGALHLFPASADGWTPRVLTCSSVAKEGIAEVWRMVLDHRELLEGNGFLAQLRNLQALQWMNELTMLGLEELFRRDRAVAERLPLLREEVHGGRMTPFAAARQLLALFHPQPTDDPSRKETL